MKKNKTNNLWHKIAVYIGLFLGAFMGYSAITEGIFFAKQTFNTQSYDQILTTIANELNKNTPARIDGDTTLTSVVALPNKTLNYNYSLSSSYELLPEAGKQEFQTSMRENVLNGIKNSRAMDELKNNKVTFLYKYFLAQNNFIFEIKINPTDYTDVISASKDIQHTCTDTWGTYPCN